MKSINLYSIIGIIAISFIAPSCASHIYNVAYPTLSDGKYDSEFPYKNCSEQLENISETIKLLNCIVTYKTYVFPQGAVLQKNDLTMDIIENKATQVNVGNSTSSGTATVIYSQGFKVAVMTCAHIVTFPDTIFTYFTDHEGSPTDYVQSVAFRQTQLNFVNDLYEHGEVEILAIDKASDIAILGKTLKNISGKRNLVFNYPIGRAKELEWGTFVYMFGYPLTNKMVTKAIVSDPNKDGRGSFLLDAVFNRGFSGGIILAVRDGVPNFELVGMVSSVPADYEYVLTPYRSNAGVEYDPNIPYQGNIFVNQKVNIKYGVTRAISIETLQDFVTRNKSLLESKGYYVGSFFEREFTPPE